MPSTARPSTRAVKAHAAVRTYRVAVIPGDGTGPEVIGEGRKVLEAAGRQGGFRFDWREYDLGGARYLKMMLENFDGDLSKALAAYNAGPGAVKKYGTIPPYRETQGYVRNVLKYYQMYRGGGRLTAFEDKNGSLVFTDRPSYP